MLLGSPPIFSSTSKNLFDRYDLPPSCTWAVLALKDYDSSNPTSEFLDTTTASNTWSRVLEGWLLENRLPTSLELTQDTFQDVMKASHQPLVVIAAVTKDSRDKVSDKLKDIGKMWRARRGQGKPGIRDVVFAWMDMDKWGSYMKSMYGISSDAGSEPPVIIADHGV